APRQARAGPVSFGRAEIRVRRVGDVVADRVVETHGAPGLLRLVAADLAAPRDHPRVVAVHEGRGAEIRARVLGGRHAVEYSLRRAATPGVHRAGDGTLLVP